jgi:hypothetical protein
MSDIIKEINELAPYLSEQDLDEWIIPKLLIHYSDKINNLASRSYGSAACFSSSSVASQAFMERAKTELRAAVNTFLFKSEHWKENRNIHPYILTCLNRLSDRIKYDTDNVKKANVPVCPGCKHIGNKEFLIVEDKLLRCRICTSELERLPNEIVSLKNKEDRTDIESNLINIFESRLKLHKVFSLHSKRGYKCTDCMRFIPESANGTYGVSCPYNDCLFFGSVSNLELMFHPVTLTRSQTTSLQISVGKNLQNSGNYAELQDIIACESMDPTISIEINQNYEYELDVILQVIEDQKSFINRTSSTYTKMQKLIMYEAYESMLKQFPEEMISYLAHRKQVSHFPIQAKIFQEYVKIIENALPFDIVQGNKIIPITSLTDENLKLFTGISEFEAIVDCNYQIPNKTTETYTGSNKFKFYGKCFIGSVIDVIDMKTNESIKNNILNYAFSHINMIPGSIPVGSRVFVKHFRIPSHYEIGSLTFLQRIRRNIVDSVYFKIYKKRRKITKNQKIETGIVSI